MTDRDDPTLALERLRLRARVAATLGVWAAAAIIDVVACRDGMPGGFDADFAQLMALLRLAVPLVAATVATAVVWRAAQPQSDFEAELARIADAR